MRSRFPKRLQKKAKRGFKGYPIGTVAFYGPDNRFASKVAVAVSRARTRKPLPSSDGTPTPRTSVCRRRSASRCCCFSNSTA